MLGYLRGLVLIVAVASLVVGIDTLAAVDLRDEQRAGILIGICTLHLAVYQTRSRLGMAAVLEVVAGVLFLLAAAPHHRYMLGYGIVALAVAAISAGVAIAAVIRPPRNAVVSTRRHVAAPATPTAANRPHYRDVESRVRRNPTVVKPRRIDIRPDRRQVRFRATRARSVAP